jgi:hypothetical protein
MWNDHYENKILEKFRGNNFTSLILTLGLVKEAFELRLQSINKQRTHRFSFDIFLIYKLNETYQWNGYQGNRQLFR